MNSSQKLPVHTATVSKSDICKLFAQIIYSYHNILTSLTLSICMSANCLKDNLWRSWQHLKCTEAGHTYYTEFHTCKDMCKLTSFSCILMFKHHMLNTKQDMFDQSRHGLFRVHFLIDITLFKLVHTYRPTSKLIVAIIKSWM